MGDNSWVCRDDKVSEVISWIGISSIKTMMLSLLYQNKRVVISQMCDIASIIHAYSNLFPHTDLIILGCLH